MLHRRSWRWIGLGAALAVLVALAVPAAAAPAITLAKRDQGGPPPGLIHAKAVASAFADVREALWAKKSIELLHALSVIRGYEDGLYRPNKPVTRAEAVVMLVRALGWEAEAEGQATLGFRDADRIPAWARSAVAIAVERGLLEAEGSFEANKPATRAWVAMLLVRAADVDADLASRLTFADATEIPVELQAYVRMAVALGWFRGYPGNVFKPNKPITRAEMATLLDRFLDAEEVDSTLSGLVRGELVAVADGTVTVRTHGDAQLTLPIADDVQVFVDGEEAAVADLEAGMRVKLQVVGGRVSLIDARTPDEDEEDSGQPGAGEDEESDEFRVEGRIEALYDGDDRSLTVAGTTYAVASDAEVEDANGEEIGFADLRVGWTVRLEGEVEDGNRVVTEIHVLATSESEL